MAEVISGKIPAARDAEVLIERPDGSRGTVVVNIRPLKNEQGEITGAINCFYDITERKQAEEALRQSEAQSREHFESAEAARISADAARTRAETATRAKDEFLAALSHELRTPLNPALLLASSLADDVELSSRVRSDVEIIGKAIALQAQLVDDLLDITRITGGKLRLDLHPLDAHTALRHACDILGSEVQERQIEITLCGHVIANDEVLVVEDLSRDRRFANNPLLRERGLRFYAGIPLRSNNLPIGSLCILDVKPRRMTEREKRLLEVIAEDVMDEIKRRDSVGSPSVMIA